MIGRPRSSAKERGRVFLMREIVLGEGGKGLLEKSLSPFPKPHPPIFKTFYQGQA